MFRGFAFKLPTSRPQRRLFIGMKNVLQWALAHTVALAHQLQNTDRCNKGDDAQFFERLFGDTDTFDVKALRF